MRSWVDLQRFADFSTKITGSDRPELQGGGCQVIVTKEILEKLMEMPEWEGQLEEQPGGLAVAKWLRKGPNGEPRNFRVFYMILLFWQVS